MGVTEFSFSCCRTGVTLAQNPVLFAQHVQVLTIAYHKCLLFLIGPYQMMMKMMYFALCETLCCFKRILSWSVCLNPHPSVIALRNQGFNSKLSLKHTQSWNGFSVGDKRSIFFDFWLKDKAVPKCVLCVGTICTYTLYIAVESSRFFFYIDKFVMIRVSF